MNSNIRFAHRIMTQTALLPGPREPESYVKNLQERAELQSASLSTIPIIVADNVADFYATTRKAVFDFGEMPSILSPFAFCFVEWNVPERWFLDDKWVEHPSGQQGVFVARLNVPEKNRSLERIAELICVLCGGGLSQLDGVKQSLSCFANMDVIDKCRFIIMMDGWITNPRYPLFNKPFWSGLFTFMFLGERGEYLKHIVSGPSARALSEKGLSSKELIGESHIACLTFSFMHCKNVRQVDAVIKPPQGMRQHKKVPKLTFKTIVVDPMIAQSARNTSVGIGVAGKALHICRGHFASYSEDKPLFGKYTGTFWRPDHVRGKIEEGEVIKNYAVNPAQISE